MATTTNFGWETPDDTDLVKDGAAAIRTALGGVDTSFVDLKGGTTGQYLTKQTNTDLDFQWITPVVGDITAVNAGTGISGGGTSGDVTVTNSMATAIDAKGDLIAGTANDAFARVPVGSNGAVLVANSGQATGMSWTASPTSLTTLTTSSDITVNGVKIGQGNGGLSTLVGTGAMPNASGLYNHAFGYAALAAVTFGTNNHAFGASALGQTTGSTNTAIGQDAGYNLTTGSNNSFFGNAAQPSSATVSNTITLGNSSITSLRCQVTSITALSDARDKTNISDLNVGLDFVKALKPVTFDWNMRQPENPRLDENGDAIIEGKVGVPDTGFIAQDIIEIEDASGIADYLQLSYRDNPDQLEITQGRLIPILVKAIQDLTAKVEALEAAK